MNNHLSALIVDESSSYTQSIVASLKELGCSEERIFVAKKYKDAKDIINLKKPDILITEYLIDGKYGLELINFLTSQSANKISVIISRNNSRTSIAEAAEELVDDYIVKPFQTGMIFERLKTLIHRKLNPSEYIKNIRAGKQMLLESRFQDAEYQFKSAIQIEKKPTLAHYYLGYTKLIQTNYAVAVDEFKKGLNLQPLHYKCLTGNFDAFFEQKSYGAAYLLTPAILNNYPIGPKRLGNLFIAAVFSGQLDDVPKYYNIFLNLDHITLELRKVFSAALLAAGRFQLSRNETDKAAECFELGIQVIGPDMDYIDRATRALLKAKDRGHLHAVKLLQRTPNAKVGGKEHSALSFLTNLKTQTTTQAIEQGRRLVANGYADADCYQSLIKILVADDKITLAEDITAKAVRDYPSLRKALYDLLESREQNQTPETK
jgi:DNA-binding response OmpR family regulator